MNQKKRLLAVLPLKAWLDGLVDEVESPFYCDYATNMKSEITSSLILTVRFWMWASYLSGEILHPGPQEANCLEESNILPDQRHRIRFRPEIIDQTQHAGCR